MRWRLTLLVALATSAVVLAFLIPLTLLMRSLAAERTVVAATTQAQTLATAAVGSGRAGVQEQLQRDAAERIGKVTVFLPDGPALGDEPEVPPIPLAEKAREEGLPVIDRRNGEVTVYAPALGAQGTTLVRVRITSQELYLGVERTVAVLAGLGLVMLTISGLAADVLGRRVSRPIRQVAAAADALQEGQLDTRVPEGQGTPEVRAMSRALNRLAGRIEELLIAERESVADLSHRLRTPVTALRLDADSITDPELAARLNQHVDHLERTVDAVVRDARRPVRSQISARCDVAAVTDERVTFWSALADEQGRRLRARLPARPAWARIDQVDLTDVIDVLIDNVFSHTDDGVRLEVSVQELPGGEIALAVDDSGPGLPGRDVVTRGHSSAGSSGLGLDIVRRTAIASGGRLELGTSPLGGAQVRVVLAAADSREPTRRALRPRGQRGPARRWWLPVGRSEPAPVRRSPAVTGWLPRHDDARTAGPALAAPLTAPAAPLTAPVAPLTAPAAPLTAPVERSSHAPPPDQAPTTLPRGLPVLPTPTSAPPVAVEVPDSLFTPRAKALSVPPSDPWASYDSWPHSGQMMDKPIRRSNQDHSGVDATPSREVES